MVDGVELRVRPHAVKRKWPAWAAIAVVFVALTVAAALTPMSDDTGGSVDHDLANALPGEHADAGTEFRRSMPTNWIAHALPELLGRTAAMVSNTPS